MQTVPIGRSLSLSQGYAMMLEERQMGKVVRKSHGLGDRSGMRGMDGEDFTKTVLRPWWPGEGRAEPGKVPLLSSSAPSSPSLRPTFHPPSALAER